MPTLDGTWAYYLVWHPGVDVDTYRVAAMRRGGQLMTWDVWHEKATLDPPTYRGLLETFYMATSTAMERDSHRA